MTASILLLTIGAALLAFVALSLAFKANSGQSDTQSAKVTYSSPDRFVGPNRNR
jgi:hypothetical protein